MDADRMTIGEALERKAEMEESRDNLYSIAKILQSDKEHNADISNLASVLDAGDVIKNAGRLLNIEIKELDRRIKNAVLS